MVNHSLVPSGGSDGVKEVVFKLELMDPLGLSLGNGRACCLVILTSLSQSDVSDHCLKMISGTPNIPMHPVWTLRVS